MRTRLTTAVLLLVPALATAAPWNISESDRLTLEWDFTRKITETKNGTPGRLVDHRAATVGLKPKTITEKRVIFSIELTDYTWHQANSRFEVKITPKNVDIGSSGDMDGELLSASSKLQNRMMAALRADYELIVTPKMAMIRRTDAEDEEKKKKLSFFEHCYLHSPLPKKLENRVEWKDETAKHAPQFGPMDARPVLTFKLKMKRGAPSARAKKKENLKGEEAGGVRYAGKTRIERSFEFHRDGHLAESEETVTSAIKKSGVAVDMQGSLSVEQSMEIKKN